MFPGLVKLFVFFCICEINLNANQDGKVVCGEAGINLEVEDKSLLTKKERKPFRKKIMKTISKPLFGFGLTVCGVVSLWFIWKNYEQKRKFKQAKDLARKELEREELERKELEREDLDTRTALETEEANEFEFITNYSNYEKKKRKERITAFINEMFTDLSFDEKKNLAIGLGGTLTKESINDREKNAYACTIPGLKESRMESLNYDIFSNLLSESLKQNSALGNYLERNEFFMERVFLEYDQPDSSALQKLAVGMLNYLSRLRTPLIPFLALEQEYYKCLNQYCTLSLENNDTKDSVCRILISIDAVLASLTKTKKRSNRESTFWQSQKKSWEERLKTAGQSLGCASAERPTEEQLRMLRLARYS